MPIFRFSFLLFFRRCLDREESDMLLESWERDGRFLIKAGSLGLPFAGPATPAVALSVPSTPAADPAIPVLAASSLSESGGSSSPRPSTLYIRSLAQSFRRSVDRLRSTNSAMTSLGGQPWLMSAAARFCLQNWCQAWRHSSSAARRPLRTSRNRPRELAQSILRCRSLGGAVAAVAAPCTSGSAPGASCRADRGRAGATPPALGPPVSCAGVLPAAVAASDAAFGFVPTALKASAATASQRRRTTPSRSPWPPTLRPSSSRTSKASRRPKSLRSVLGSRLCGGHSLRHGCPKSPSSAPRCATKSRNARARGQLTMGHWCSSSCSSGLALLPVSTGWTGAVALLRAETRRTCRSSLSLSAARLAARQSVAL
mmetsp:Transcript_6676/g.20765  ORF Transcript_6676/g.20765 Transcript_6676/m.20765 type:complete len:371 (-) Transcript_6676:1-1113(-)